MATDLATRGWQRAACPVCPPTGLLGALLNIVYYGSSGSGNGQFNYPNGIAFTSDGSRFAVADSGNNRIQIFGLSSNTVTHQVSYGSSGSGNGQFSNPFGIAFTPDGQRFAVADSGNNRIQIFGLSSNTVTHQVSYGLSGSGNGQFSNPHGIAFTSDGSRFAVADSSNNRIQIL